ncbi:LysE family translocator [Burkholderia plantarii]|nr:LysE family translocator [Burkholderia plantarii]
MAIGIYPEFAFKFAFNTEPLFNSSNIADSTPGNAFIHALFTRLSRFAGTASFHNRRIRTKGKQSKKFFKERVAPPEMVAYSLSGCHEPPLTPQSAEIARRMFRIYRRARITRRRIEIRPDTDEFMLNYDFAHWIAFLTMAILLNISPGPDIAFILGNTLKSGRRHGFAAMLGIWVGALFHVSCAAIGLSAILYTSATMFLIVKWVGVAYLTWLGIQALLSKAGAFHINEPAKPRTISEVFFQGAFIDILNPKVAIFFLALLPQFVVDGAGPVPLQLAVHGILIIAVAALVEPPLILLGDRLAARIRANQKAATWIDRTLGVFFLGLATKLAVFRQ